ncbi:Uncharacterized aarF domain-containing protein kinase 2 [Harpegnathos saltator]|uniref:Uncharacterized aarF domain-containing protein kinase 2 n=1 Tax=Harpegnathos saltator TaxID=610380 RepID=E2B6K0_HARSA|nr:Uncharacterized aarF domain-containing protein kinase 2 [Harpegnathos saltator]
MREAILILTRIMVISSVISTLLAAYLITRLTHATLFPTILRKGIEFLGPIFVKFGQWISIRRDIFPRDICDCLSQLQQNVTPHSWLYTKRLLKATYGSSWRDLFVKFDDEGPIGSGCCAQVYKAWIDLNEITGVAVAARDSRVSRFVENETPDENDKNDVAAPAGPRAARKLQAVAVKVLHPGIKGQLKRDIAIMHGLCKCATYFIPELHWLSLTDCIDEFARIMQDQVNANTVVTELFSAMVHHRVKQDASFSSAILSVLIVESLGRHLDPKIDIFAAILPFVVSSTIYGV